VWVLLGDDQQQQQAPVAAEKQRRAMQARMSFCWRWRSILMMRLQARGAVSMLRISSE
jgi:hypothetical protein